MRQLDRLEESHRKATLSIGNARILGDGRYVARIERAGERAVQGRPGIAAGARVLIVIRPEGLDLALGPARDGAMSATVIDISFRGAQRPIRLRSTALGELVATTSTGHPAPDPGAEMSVSWSDEHAWAVPTATTEQAASPPDLPAREGS
jgi:hypothetical protein